MEQLSRFSPLRFIVVVVATLGLGGPLSLVVLGAALAGCTPGIGDKCTISTECSVRGDRQCDLSQPGGYCTVFNCTTASSPGGSTCILFEANVPGCVYTDRRIARTARSYCLENCRQDSDCRSGYVCGTPTEAPWSALNLDNKQEQQVCIAAPPGASRPVETGGTDAAVCQASGPDAGIIDASVPDARIDGAVPPDGGPADAEADAGDASDEGG